ncbi:MAG: hypothetical protein O3A55_01025 [Bacteroidetes bacterium]|nr:hypothetical protein [Bacteroidota bacterium]
MKLVFFVLFPILIFAQEKNYFYVQKDFGSVSIFNPATNIINCGFDILQSASHTRQLDRITLGKGLKNVWNNISDPFSNIEVFGWDKFISREVLPLSFSLDKAQWVPNYTLHLVAGGFNFRMLYEYYNTNNYPAPMLFASTTFGVSHLLNEAVENQNYVGVNVDPIADLLIFNIAGPILFLNNDVAEFFSETLEMADWSSLPAYNPTFGTIENQGQHFSVRYKPNGWDSKLFYYLGDHGMVGLSIPKNENTSLTFAAGTVMKQLRTVDEVTAIRTISVDLGWIAGVFYDKENSLLASLIFSNRINEKMKLNIYPGIFEFYNVSPGIFIHIGSNNQLVCGLMIKATPFGLAYRSQR